MRRLMAALISTLLLAIGLAVPAAAQTGTIAVSVSCGSNPERTTITNNTNQALNLSGFTLSSINDPRSNEPFALSGTVAAGASVTFQTGTGATANVLTNQFIYDNEAANEGARLGTPFGTLTVLCSAGSNSLQLPGATTTPTTPTPAATATTRPAATATAVQPQQLPQTGDGGMAGSEPVAAGLLALFGLSLAGGAVAYRRRVSS